LKGSALQQKKKEEKKKKEERSYYNHQLNDDNSIIKSFIIENIDILSSIGSIKISIIQ
jgi:hypothetical protein